MLVVEKFSVVAAKTVESAARGTHPIYQVQGENKAVAAAVGMISAYAEHKHLRQ